MATTEYTTGFYDRLPELWEETTKKMPSRKTKKTAIKEVETPKFESETIKKYGGDKGKWNKDKIYEDYLAKLNEGKTGKDLIKELNDDQRWEALDNIINSFNKDYENYITSNPEYAKSLNTITDNNALQADLDNAMPTTLDTPFAIKQASAKQAADMLNKQNSFLGLSNDQLEQAPIWGAVGNVIADIAGLQNKNNFAEAEALENFARNLKPNLINYNPNYNYATYNPTNTNSAIDQMLAANSMNVANLNNSGLGAAERQANMLQNNKNLFTSMGSVVNQINQANNAEKNNVRNINNAIDLQNAQQSVAAQQANAAARANVDAQRLSALQQALGLRISERQTNDTAKAANINSLFTNLFNLGRDRINRNNANAIGSIYGYEGQNGGGYNYINNNTQTKNK